MSSYITGDISSWQSRCFSLGNSGSYGSFKQELDNYVAAIPNLAFYQKSIWSGELAKIESKIDWTI